MAAVATDKDAVVFNPAYPNFGSYALNPYSYKGKAVSYVVRGEFLNVIAGEPNVGEVRYIGEYWKKDDDENGEEAKTEAFGDHRMGVIKNLLRREKNVKIQ